MNETIIAAFITLFGSILTVYVGYRQWKHQQEKNYLPIFQNERHEFYRELWSLLPDLSTKIKGHQFPSIDNYALVISFSEDELNEILEQVRLFLLKNELHILSEDGMLVIHYLENAIIARKNFLKLGEIEDSPMHTKIPNLSNNLKIASVQISFWELRIKLFIMINRKVIFKVMDNAIKNPSSIWVIIWAFLAPFTLPQVSTAMKQVIRASLALKKSRQELLTRFRQVANGRA